MKLAKPVTQTFIAHVKESVNLDRDSEAQRTFSGLSDIVKAQLGFISQYWGHQVENPNIFVWCVDWESLDHYKLFSKSEAHESVKSRFYQEFGLEAKPPLTILTNWTSDSSASFRSRVTEVAFYTLPHGATSAAKADIEESLKPVDEAVQSAGKATGAATGWAYDEKSPSEEWLQGAYGYNSIEDHWRWREHPKHKMAMEIMKGLEERLVTFNIADVPGIDPVTGYFHVEFQRGE